MATLLPDGSPHVSVVWVAREGDRILLGVRDGSLKGRNTRRDPRVALSITALANPYEMAQIRGRVVERRPDADYRGKDAMSARYLGRPFPYRGWPDQMLLVIEPERVRYTKVSFTHAPPRA